MVVDRCKIADSVLRTMSEETKAEIGAMEEEHLWMLHHTLGRWIRNTHSLWEDPHEPEIVCGVDTSPNHPDAISMDIIRIIHQKVKTCTETKTEKSAQQ